MTNNERRYAEKRGGIERQITALRSQLAALQSQLDASLEELEVVDKDEKVALEKHASAKCRSICEMMQRKLPREIRDMVYGYLTTYDEVAILAPNEDTSPKTDFVLHNYIILGSLYLSDDTSWARDYTVKRVGDDTLRELTENYYRTSRFNCFLTDSKAIEAFLSTSDPIVGILPTEALRNLSIDITTEDLIQDHQNGLLHHYQSLKSLCAIKSWAKVNLVFRDTCWASTLNDEEINCSILFDVALILRNLLPMLRNLTQSDVKLTIAFEGFEQLLPCSGFELNRHIRESELSLEKLDSSIMSLSEMKKLRTLMRGWLGGAETRNDGKQT